LACSAATFGRLHPQLSEHARGRIREDDPDKGAWADEAVAEAVIDMMADLNMVDLINESERRKFTINPEFKNLIIETAKERYQESDKDLDQYVLQLVLISLLEKISQEACTVASIALLTEMNKVVHELLDLPGLLATIER
jgi:hypothetical protein